MYSQLSLLCCAACRLSLVTKFIGLCVDVEVPLGNAYSVSPGRRNSESARELKSTSDESGQTCDP